MQPTIVVVSAELYCVQITMEYIKMNLHMMKEGYFSLLL